MPIYDSIPNYRAPEWLVSYVNSRNEVSVHPDVLPQVEKIKARLCHYQNEPEVFIQAMKETLEAEVRSKFQTLKQMEFTERGSLVAVPFDETIVRYRWVSERSFEIMEVTLKSMDKASLEAQKILHNEEEAYDETLIEIDVSDDEESSREVLEKEENAAM